MKNVACCLVLALLLALPGSSQGGLEMAERVCPWWVGYLLASPVRRLLENPEAVIAPHLSSGATAMDVGSGMGFFSLPMAERVGPLMDLGVAIIGGCCGTTPDHIRAIRAAIDCNR